MSEAYQPEGCRDVVMMLDAIATVLNIPDGQRGVLYYLTEAHALLARGDHSFALSALEDALSQDDCSPKQWSRIMRAIRYTKKAIHDGR